MGIAVENFGKGHAIRLSRAIMVQAGSSLDDKVSMNVEHECITLAKGSDTKADQSSPKLCVNSSRQDIAYV